MSTRKNVLTLFFAAVLAFGLAACGGGSTTPPDPVPPPPTPYEMAMAGIAAADTAEAAQAAYDAVKDDVTAAEGDRLQAAVDARVAALMMMARADAQRMALADAAGMIDTSDLSTQALVDAARMAIAGLRQAIADAVDVADTSMYQSMLDDAVGAVDAAQGGIDTATRRTNQMDALSGASTTLQAALAALSGSTPTQAQLDAANAALTALNDAITAGADLTDTEKAPYQREADNAAAPISTAQTAFDNAEDEDAKQQAEMMAATAAKLYAGVSMPVGDANTPAATDRAAAYNDAGTPTDATADTRILVTIGNGTDTPAPIVLSEDKETTVTANHGWAGKRYADPAGGDMVEAYVYSNVEAPKQGRKFGSAAAVTDTGAYEYQLADGALAAASLTAAPANVAITGVTRTAGTETFKLPDPNPNNVQIITRSGSFHGVSGTYSCDTGAGRDGTCTAAVAAAGGFTLGGTGTWTFKPSSAEARVMESADTAYASYGWWLRKAANDGPFTASAFHDVKGTVTALVDATLNALEGTATYMGGAAGKYALASSTGGTNDAGHFTARATLEADFGDGTAGGTITGTIDSFMGADGMGRDWSVELKEASITAAAPIATLTRTDDNDTVWTIGETAAAASGEWSGALRNQGDDGVPQVATGTFYSEYGTAGKIVGAFGANVE